MEHKNKPRLSACTDMTGDSVDSRHQKNMPCIQINMLTKRKSERDTCELCELTGALMCANCKMTFYCTMDHFELDKDFHAIVCSRVKELRKPIEFSPQSETRERWIKQRRIRMLELYTFTKNKGQAHLEEGKYDSAIPAATVSTKYAQALFGQSAEVIPPLLITAECYLHKGKLVVADGFLARALSIEVSAGNIKPSIKARIRRNEGLIYLARNRLDDALECFSEEIYQNTEEFGPYHIRTSTGYCYLGHVFHLMGQTVTAMSLFRQTVDIWIKHIEPIIEQMLSVPLNPMLGVVKDDKVWMEHADKFEGLRLLIKCYNQQLEVESATDVITMLDLATTCYAIGLMYYVSERYSECKNKALEGQVRVSSIPESEMPQRKRAIIFKLHLLVKWVDRKLFAVDRLTIQGSDTETSINALSLTT